MPDHSPDDEFDSDAGPGVGPDPDDAAAELAWQAIVDNYGDRVELDDPPAAAPPAPPAAPVSDVPFGGRFGDPRAFQAYDGDPDEPPVDPALDEAEEEGFVPPEPPPLPTIAPDRGLAWAGVFGSPAVLLAALIFSVSIPAWLGYLLVIGFVGGFVYLVLQMPREPRDPWDDGAQI